MNKHSKKFLVVWLIAVIAFNIIAFAVTAAADIGFNNSLWIIYVAIMAGFIGEFVCTRFVINAGSSERMFLNLPVITISVISMIFLIIVGVALVVIQSIPYWIAILVSVIVLAVSAIMVVNSTVAAESIEENHEAVQASQDRIRMLTARAKIMMDSAAEPAAKKEFTKVYEALRYSDPISNPALAQVEDEIEELVADMRNLESDLLHAHVLRITALIKERNAMCKTLK